MIVVKLKGGLGNQMFQYAYGRALALKRGTLLGLDKSFLQSKLWQKIVGVTPREYELDKFNIQAELIRDKYPLEGYWQSEKYFKDIRPILLKDFTLRSKSDNFLKFEKLVSDNNSVSVHFRRGDYIKRKVTRNYHGVLGFDYYLQAIEIIKQKIKNPHFFLFSDDSTISSFSGLNSAEELILMSLCRHNIIANSSFSWWGAWLNNNPKKIVIAPKKWFNAIKTDLQRIPRSWIKL